ncbi:MAG TPA: type II toxin-antitoxin system VapC family toxin [Acetobacteraceae bacterium]|nr:type II toxin-antitoxin system VapC family toxin [Acetobacteraceae bacterium]
MAFVLDASIALAAVLRGERKAEVASEILARIPDEGAFVPALWHLEVGNTVLVRRRRGHVSSTETEKILERLRALPVMLDCETPTRALDITFRLALSYTLSLYDASYLELALRRGLSLASLDRALRDAAAEMGVPLLPGT